MREIMKTLMAEDIYNLGESILINAEKNRIKINNAIESLEFRKKFFDIVISKIHTRIDYYEHKQPIDDSQSLELAAYLLSTLLQGKQDSRHMIPKKYNEYIRTLSHFINQTIMNEGKNNENKAYSEIQ